MHWSFASAAAVSTQTQMQADPTLDFACLQGQRHSGQETTVPQLLEGSLTPLSVHDSETDTFLPVIVVTAPPFPFPIFQVHLRLVCTHVFAHVRTHVCSGCMCVSVCELMKPEVEVWNYLAPTGFVWQSDTS